jgi:hypothetical protein
MRRRPTRSFLRGVVVIAASLALLLCCACASAAVPPSIESESASNITPTDATLEAQINPGDAPDGVYYQFQIASDLGEYVSEIVCPPEPSSGPAHPCIGAHSSDALPIGFIGAGSGSSSVSLDLAGAGVKLQPGTSYQFRVFVAKAVQSEDTTEWEAPTVVGAVQGFTTPSPVPPSIESESASNITPTGAALEAQINPGDAPDGIYYQFQIASDPDGFNSEIICPLEPTSGPFHPCVGAHSPGALPIRFIPAGSGPSSVSLDLASVGVMLHPGATYHYRVLVAKAVLTEDTIEWESPPIAGADQTFTTSPQPPPTTDPDPQVGGAGQLLQSPSLSQPHRHHRRHHRKHNRRVLHRGTVSQASLAD